MTQPDDGPADFTRVRESLGIPSTAQGADIDDLTDAVAAVNALVRQLPVAELTGSGPEPWPATVTLGAQMLAKRLFRRRNTVSGVETFGDQGAVYVQRNDPDIAQLLQLGPYKKPMVG